MKITPVGIMKWAGSLFCGTLVVYVAGAVILTMGRVLFPWEVPALQFVYGLFSFLFTGVACAFIVYLFGEAISEIIPRKKEKLQRN